MNKITLKCLSSNPWGCCLTIIKKRFKSITGLAVLMLFLLVSYQSSAQIVIGDNDISDWYAALENGAITAKVFVSDANDTNDSQFTNGAQDPDFISEWAWTYGQTNDKGDISNSGAVLLNNRIYFFGDRTAINGDAQIGFWFFLGGVGPDGDGVGNDPFTGMHVEGDLLALSNFTNGGGVVNLRIFRWVDNPADAFYDTTPLPDPINAPNGDESSGNLKFLGVTTNAFVNTQPINITVHGPFAASVIGGQDHMTLSTWNYQGKNVPSEGVPPYNQYHTGAFFNGFISLDGLPPGAACFSSYLLETRNSQSVTASLQDFVGAGFTTVPPPPLANPVNYCQDDIASALTATGTNLLWYDDAGLTTLHNGDGSAPVPDTSTPGMTSYWVTQATENGCESEGTEVVVTVDPPANAGDDNSTTVCDGTMVDLSSLVSVGGGSFADDDATGALSGSNFDTTGLSPGTYNFTYTVLSGNTCPDDSALIQVTVNPNPSCNAYADNPLACFGVPITLHVTGSGGLGGADQSKYSFLWSGSGSEYLDDTSSANPTMSAAAPISVYNLTVTVTDISSETNCTSTCNVSVEVYNCTPNCETAFGVATQHDGGYDTVDESISSCFRNDGFSRWGWTNKISGFGEHVFSLYAGAAQCILGKGAYAGTVTLNYENDGTVTVTYNMAPGYVLSEAHVYIGCDPYPKTKKGKYTVAPGQYSFNAGNLGYVQTDFSTPAISASGDFYFIAHAVVCEKDIPEGCYLPGSPYEGGVFDYPTSPIETDCDVDTGGWGKVANSKDVTFTAYPVPFENEINISYKFDYDTYVNIDVYDAKGSLIKKAVNNNYIKGTVDKTTLDLSRADNQMYFVRLMTSKGMLVKKIISTSKLSRE